MGAWRHVRHAPGRIGRKLAQVAEHPLGGKVGALELEALQQPEIGRRDLDRHWRRRESLRDARAEQRVEQHASAIATDAGAVAEVHDAQGLKLQFPRQRASLRT